MSHKLLVICGPTATGKTSLSLRLAKEFSGEIISADSRQVYTGKDIITGKDIPPEFVKNVSPLRWRDQSLTNYSDKTTKIWMLDVVSPGESFNVSFWLECATIIIKDIHFRNKLPIVVGGTGLYIKSLVFPMPNIIIPPNPELRIKFKDCPADLLYQHLNSVDPTKARSLNPSDRKNPRRLIRALEIAQYPSIVPLVKTFPDWDVKIIGLTAPRKDLFQRIDQRVEDRIKAGAVNEDPDLVNNPDKWKYSEHALARRQLTWFSCQPGIQWFDITLKKWYQSLHRLVLDWYNETTWDKK
jgi:tRNA dimethylallyltransferase